MHIVSASRRTDIPAFYSEWLLNRLKAGTVQVANPFSGKEYTVSLDPEQVAALVLWSKDFSALEPRLDELDRMGHRLYFLFSITGLPDFLEPNTPKTAEAAACLRRLSDRYGPGAVVWRFDPIILGNKTTPQWTRETFARLCRELEGATSRCITSFVDYYRKLDRAVRTLSAKGTHLYEPTASLRFERASDLLRIAQDHGIKLSACCEPDLVEAGVEKASCVDGPAIYNHYGLGECPLPIRPTRRGCGCTQSRDIGAYDTCAHGCLYCYANSNASAARKRAEGHDPFAERLG